MDIGTFHKIGFSSFLLWITNFYTACSDFLFELSDGRKFRLFNAIDDYRREGIAI